MNRSLGVRFGLAVFAFVWMPVVALLGYGYFLWKDAAAARERPSAALASLALRGDALKLTEAASGLVESIDRFMIDRIGEAQVWAASPVVVAAVRRARDAHAKQGLDTMAIQQVEDQFRISKTLGLAPDAEAYMREQIKSSPHFAEVFFTDRQGYNVALTNPTSDFVQSDEAWWQRAWSSGFSVGEIEFDESAGVWSLDLSVRIHDPDTRDPVGVMKAVVSTRFVQLFADHVARRLSAPGQLLHPEVSAAPDNGAPAPADQVEVDTHLLVATTSGQLIAETRSGHARGRIMRPEVNLLSSEPLRHLKPAYEGDRSGAFVAERMDHEGGSAASSHLVAFARTGSPDVYAQVAEGFTGFDWMVVVDAPNLSGLTAVPGTLEPPAPQNWLSGIFALGVGVCASLLLATLLLHWLFGKWVLAPVLALTDRVRRMGQGQIGGKITVSSTDEFADLAKALDQVRQVIGKLADRVRPAA